MQWSLHMVLLVSGVSTRVALLFRVSMIEYRGCYTPSHLTHLSLANATLLDSATLAIKRCKSTGADSQQLIVGRFCT
jgi:hypothetical protein